MIEFKSTTWLSVEGVLSAVRDAGMKPLMKAGLLVEREAKTSMARGGRRGSKPAGVGAKKLRGRGEYWYWRADIRKWVQASKPGEPPHVQSGVLRGSIATQATGYATVVVGPTSPPAWYGVVHEQPGRPAKHHPRRPFMAPALRRVRSVFAKFWRNLPLAKTRAGRKLNRRKK